VHVAADEGSVVVVVQVRDVAGRGWGEVAVEGEDGEEGEAVVVVVVASMWCRKPRVLAPVLV
jgi:hypothetical protein